jgi:peptidoglycan/LPS O-acetylase OafA/YrhL
VPAGVIYLAAFLGSVRLTRTSAYLSDYLLAVCTMAFLWVLLSAREAASGGWADRLARASARFSYTLYLVHMPLLVLLAGFLVHDKRWQPTGMHVLVGGSVFACLLVYAWLVASFTEFRTDLMRARVERTLGMRPATIRENKTAPQEATMA